MEIKNAKFVVSSSRVQDCPSHPLPEYAFIGRSNVGKSSLINMLTRRKGLAMTSATPGKTMLINHFLIDDSWYLVDLPGYGYARRGKESREALRKMIEGYALRRHELTCLFVLLDCRHKPQQIDLDFMEWLGENGVPFAIVFTKTDKVGPVALHTAIEHYKSVLHETWEELPPIFTTSSERGYRSGRTARLHRPGEPELAGAAPGVVNRGRRLFFGKSSFVSPDLIRIFVYPSRDASSRRDCRATGDAAFNRKDYV